eukprot:15276664-Alexandrium_andersonii.AAC.1
MCIRDSCHRRPAKGARTCVTAGQLLLGLCEPLARPLKMPRLEGRAPKLVRAAVSTSRGRASRDTRATGHSASCRQANAWRAGNPPVSGNEAVHGRR